MPSKKSLVIIGAGIAGLALAHRLKQHYEIVLVDKARGVGGRMSSRYAHPYYFDHAVQSFTVTTPELNRFIAPYKNSGIIMPWNPVAVTIDGESGEVEPYESSKQHYVAIPGMNSLAKELSLPFPVIPSTRITSMHYDGEWRLADEEGQTHGPFDAAVITTPAEQAAAILPGDHPFNERINKVEMLGCFTMLIGMDEMPAIDWQTARIDNSILQAVYISSAKPGRPATGSAAIVVHSANQWAQERLDGDLEAVQAGMWREITRLTGLNESKAIYNTMQRWRYARTLAPLGEAFLSDPELNLGLCGDWCIGSTVEKAFQSAWQLADAMGASHH